MMGMINGKAPDIGPKMNPLLEQAEAKIAASVKPEMRATYIKVVTRAVQLATNDEVEKMLFESLKTSQDPINDVAVGAVGIMLILVQKAKGTLPLDVLPPAGMTVVLQGLNFIEPITGRKITPDDIASAHNTFMANLLPKIGVTDEVMQKAAQGAKMGAANPEVMAQYRASQGGAK